MSEFWRDRSVLVTGCTGLLGNWLVAEVAGTRSHGNGISRELGAKSDFIQRGHEK
jgi:CDP-glucose 4,6-dehydratase